MTDTIIPTEGPAAGDLPKGWTIRSLSEVTLRISKIDPVDLGRSTFKYVDIGSINSSANTVETPQFLGVESAPGRARQHLKFQDSVFSTVRPYLRNIAWVDESLDGEIGSTGFCVLRPNSALVNPRFIRFFSISDSLLDQVLPLQRGVSYPAVRDKEVLAAEIPVPPLAEQERIVEILEEQLSRLDAALESVRVVREKAAQFRRSLLHAAFTGALTGHNPTNGELPEGWRSSPLGELATLSLGKMLDRKQFTGLNPVPYLRNINVRWDEFNLEDIQIMDISAKELERVSLKSGDVVVCEGGEPGRSAVWNGKDSIAIQKALHRVRPDSRLDSRFLYFVLEREFRGSREHPLFTGTTIKHLPKEKIATVEVPFPPLAEQERIVMILDEQLSRLDAALAVADAIEKRSAALRRSLLHAAFTGRLTEQWRESVHV